MGWSAVVLVPHRVVLNASNRPAADKLAKALVAQYDAVGEHGAKLLQVESDTPALTIPDDLPPPPMAA